MLKTPELSHALSSTPVIDLAHRKNEKESSLPEDIRLKGEEIGAHLYPALLELTAQDSFEKGITVSKGIFGKITTSEIASGTRSRVDFPPPPFLNRVLSYVHTHPPLAKVNPYMPTSLPSDNDYLTFANSDSAASVILDQGGTHVLLRKKGLLKNDLPPKDLVEKSVDLAMKTNGLTLDAMKNLASFLDSYGIGYYFSPSYTLTSEGFLELKEVRNYKILPAKQIGDKS